MSDAHTRGVTYNRMELEATRPEGFWDETFYETSYFEGCSYPGESSRDGREVGEIDVGARNHEEQVFLYVEVKSSRSGLRKARRQLERAEEFWEGKGWDMVGQVWLEDDL